mgnify:CR=1 FL=1
MEVCLHHARAVDVRHVPPRPLGGAGKRCDFTIWTALAQDSTLRGAKTVVLRARRRGSTVVSSATATSIAAGIVWREGKGECTVGTRVGATVGKGGAPARVRRPRPRRAPRPWCAPPGAPPHLGAFPVDGQDFVLRPKTRAPPHAQDSRPCSSAAQGARAQRGQRPRRGLRAQRAAGFERTLAALVKSRFSRCASPCPSTTRRPRDDRNHPAALDRNRSVPRRRSCRVRARDASAPRLRAAPGRGGARSGAA